MTKQTTGLLFSAALLSLAAASFVMGSPVPGTILRVIDGDSLLINEDGKVENVRLIGIDAPESGDSPKAERDAAKAGTSLSNILKTGKEASAYLKGLVHPGEVVTLEIDLQPRDNYGRLLAYVYLSDGKLLNEKIVSSGYAVPWVINPNVKFRKQIQAAYESAKREKRGLWGKGNQLRVAAAKGRRSRRRVRRKPQPTPGPQTEVTDQRDVSDERDVSGKPGHFK